MKIDQPSPLMFWLLVLLASAMFVPCIIVPVWKDYQAIKLAERFEVDAVEEMRHDIARQERMLDALRTDPGAVTRIAQRDLAYTRPGESSVFVNAIPPMQATTGTAKVEPVQPPAVVAKALGWLSIEEAHLAAFADPTSRTTVMYLSGGLMLAAFLIFPPRRKGSTFNLETFNPSYRR